MQKGFLALGLLLASASLSLGQVTGVSNPPLVGSQGNQVGSYQTNSWVPAPSGTSSGFPADMVLVPGDDSGNFPTQASSPVPSFWVNSEYLLWWIKDGPLPVPLLTTGNPNDSVPGALGQPGTQTLLGGGNGLGYGTFSGLRVSAGGWLDANRTFGVEGSGFLLEQRSNTTSASSDATGSPPLYFPLFRTDLGQEGSFTIADPLAAKAGSVFISSQTRLWGAESNALVNLWSQDCVYLHLLAGFRYLDLDENLGINSNLVDNVNSIYDTVTDQFRTRNQFYGGQVGTRFGVQLGQLALEATGKVALGSTHEVIDIRGSTTETGAGSPSPGVFPGGIFTQSSNIGQQTHNQFGVVPEVQGKIAYQLCGGVRVFTGYNFLYWNQVVRPGDQIDRSINPSQVQGGTLVGPAQPAPQFNQTGFWAHGVTFGLELRY